MAPARTFDPREDQRLIALALVWSLVGLYALTWAPFARWSLRPDYPVFEPGANPIDVVGNSFLLFPLSILLVLALRDGTTLRRTLLAGLLGCLVSISIEIGQLILPARVFSVQDIVLNTLGAAAAASLGTRLSERLGRQRLAIWTVGLQWCGLVILLAATALSTRQRLRLADWDSGYAILTGREVGEAPRLYQGVIRNASMCAPAENELICATSDSEPLVRSNMARAAETAQEVRLQAEVISESSEQIGPTRILTFSDGILLRNATLAQVENDLVLRVRTPLSGPNGAWIQFVRRDAIPLGRSVLASGAFRNGVIELAVQDQSHSIVQTYQFGGLRGWLLVGGLSAVYNSPLRIGTLLAAFLLAAPAGLWLGIAKVNQGKLSRPLSVVAFLLPGAGVGLLDLAAGYRPLASDFAVMLFFTAVGAAAAGWIARGGEGDDLTFDRLDASGRKEAEVGGNSSVSPFSREKPPTDEAHEVENM